MGLGGGLGDVGVDMLGFGGVREWKGGGGYRLPFG